MERDGSPRPLTVLDAVHEYQRQHINIHQPAYKRFSHIVSGLSGPLHHRPNHFNGNAAMKPRPVAPINIHQNKSYPHNKPTVVPSTFAISSSPKQQHQSSKPITRVSDRRLRFFYLYIREKEATVKNGVVEGTKSMNKNTAEKFAIENDQMILEKEIFADD